MTDGFFGPDLVAGALVAETDGDALRVFGTVLNLGDQTAGISRVSLYHSADGDITQDDTLLEEVSIDTLPPGNLIDFSAVVSTAAQEGFIGVILDRADAVAEADETNNTAATMIPAGPQALRPEDRIEPFVIVATRLNTIHQTDDFGASARLTSALPAGVHGDAVQSLSAVGILAHGAQVTSPDGAIAALENGGADLALVDRRADVLRDLSNDFVIYEIPAIPGALQPMVDTVIITEGSDGPDTLGTTQAHDLILGAGGVDTLRVDGSQSSYTLTLSPHGATLHDRSGTGGIDTLRDIERIDFDEEIALFGGTPMALTLFDGPTTLDSTDFAAITELYIAYFNRAPDALGLYYWGTQFDQGFTLPQIAASFFEQPETRVAYRDVLDADGAVQDTAAFVTSVYGNVLGRAPDQAGFAYWVDQLDTNPGITPPIFILAIINGAKFPGVPTPQTALDQAYLATKADIGTYFAAILGMSDINAASQAMALFDGTDAGRDLAVAATDAFFAQASDAETGDFLFPLVGVIDDPFANL